MLKALCTKAVTCKMLNCKINEEKYFFQTSHVNIRCDWKNTQQWFKNRRWNKEKKYIYWERTGCWRFSFYSTSSHDSFQIFFPPRSFQNSMHENKFLLIIFLSIVSLNLTAIQRKTKVLLFAVSHFFFFSHHHFPFLFFFVIISRSLFFLAKILENFNVFIWI